MHGSYKYPTSYGWNGIDCKQSFWYTLSYSVQTYHLLESPYSTDCLNYRRDTPFLSREDCVRKCRVNESNTKCGVISHETDVFSGEPNIRFAKSSEEEECIKRLDLKKYCYDMCPKDDCLITYYKPIVMTEANRGYDNLAVSVIIPSEPETTYHHKPSVELIEFLCYLASTVGLWFGVSIFSIVFNLKSIKFNTLLNYNCLTLAALSAKIKPAPKKMTTPRN